MIGKFPRAANEFPVKSIGYSDNAWALIITSGSEFLKLFVASEARAYPAKLCRI